jgi:hypothetical protein
MDFLDLGIVALAAVMVWLLYRVTRETREYAAPHIHYVYRSRPLQPWERQHDPQSGHRRNDTFTSRRGIL